jgi:hypothetical protein
MSLISAGSISLDSTFKINIFIPEGFEGCVREETTFSNFKIQEYK